MTALNKTPECFSSFSNTNAPVAFVEYKDIAVALHLTPILPHRLVCNAYISGNQLSLFPLSMSSAHTFRKAADEYDDTQSRVCNCSNDHSTLMYYVLHTATVRCGSHPSILIGYSNTHPEVTRW